MSYFFFSESNKKDMKIFSKKKKRFVDFEILKYSKVYSNIKNYSFKNQIKAHI